MSRLQKTFSFLLIISLLMGFTVFLEGDFTANDVERAEKIIALQFTAAERDSMISSLIEQKQNYENLHKVPIVNSDAPAMSFDPIPPEFRYEKVKKPLVFSPVKNVTVPKNLEDAAFYSVTELAGLIRTRKITSLQLTQMYLNRLKKYGPKLECVVILTESLAIAQASKADKEIAAGRYRGMLHGIPYGAKDLFAVKGYPTTWGVEIYKDRIIGEDATIIQKLEEAGAVLIAKLTLGELAMGDIWFGGKTKNPWNLAQGSSGSSAGSASATSAGLVAFGMGSETYGSIVSPATRCGVTGLRPTYGRVSRAGAMTLSWSMDKVGPICRTAEDCAVVLHAIHGPDGKDRTLYDVPFNYSYKTDLKRIRIGYVKTEFDSLKKEKALLTTVLELLKKMGATLVPIGMPKYPVNDLVIILSAECGAAFDDLTMTNRDDLLKQQGKNSWPNSFRSSRFIPAVEYIQANRIREKVIVEMEKLWKDVDLYVTPSFSDNLLLTNLTGHPCIVIPIGYAEDKSLTSISFIGKLFDEGTIIAAAKKIQDATDFHLRHPKVE